MFPLLSGSFANFAWLATSTNAKELVKGDWVENAEHYVSDLVPSLIAQSYI